MKSRVLAASALAAFVAFIAYIALFRFPATNPEPNWVPFRTIVSDWRYGGWEFVINFVGNLVAFLPMGLLPPLIRTRTKLWQAALFSFAISFAIEAGQYVSGRRVPDVDDLILNTAGGVLGYLAFTVSCRHSYPRAAP